MRMDRMITVVGCHAEGEVGRVITGGILPPPGKTLFEQKRYLETEADALRRLLLFEPRGGMFVHANLVVPPTQPGVDAGFIIMEPTDYPPMSGSNSMCVVTVLLETGMVAMAEPETRLVLETPGGLIEARAECRGGKCERVTVHNVPSFVSVLDAAVEVPGLGTLSVDVAYGGAFFALVDGTSLGFHFTPDEARDFVEVGETIKAAVAEQHPVVHPENPDIHTVTFTEFTAPVHLDRDGVKTGQNTVVISPGKLDRSPCGTGTSARLAALHARGQIDIGEPYRSTSIIGPVFHAEIVATAMAGDRPAIVSSLSGRAWITGLHQYTLDPSDPFPQGYTLSDTWYRVL
ncbi:proline racemase family protein [Candidatus Entotheonella palauensis]|uniref:proline racemase family protein n=1 Tax=Candidatus Entotheonella palauensis TaxID=93172 RepID=UPI000B7E318B|nr:proline racemase family protein [Candidatus Entotheonella palauensis]